MGEARLGAMAPRRRALGHGAAALCLCALGPAARAQGWGEEAPGGAEAGGRDFTPIQREEASTLVALCLPSVLEGRPVEAAGLRRAEGPGPQAVRAARGGEVWTSLYGGIWLHQAGLDACTVIAPEADPKLFAFWVERWSNGADGRAWQGRWFGRLDRTAWRRFRRRGGSPVRVWAVTGAARATSEISVRRGMGGR